MALLMQVGDKYCEFLMLRLQRVSVCQTANLLRLDDKRSNGNVFFQCDQELGLKVLLASDLHDCNPLNSALTVLYLLIFLLFFSR